MRIVHIAIIILVYLLVMGDESVNTAILESISSLNAKFDNYLVYGYLILSIFGALLQAGWSDFHCRRKTIIFTYFAIFASCICITLYNVTNFTYLAFIALILKALLGNAIPVGLAILADITPSKYLKSIIAGAIVAVSVGVWMPIYLRPSASHNSQMSLVLSLITLCILFLIYKFLKDDYFDRIKFQKNTASFSKFIAFFKKDTIHLYSFFVVPVIAFAIIYFNFSEISYYQPLLRGELLVKSKYFSNQSLVLAIGYYIGIAILIVVDVIARKKQIKDSLWLKLGAVITLLSLVALVVTSYYSSSYSVFFYVLMGLFSLGYAFRDPTLYSSLSKVCKLEDQGKVFGAFDSSESFSTIISTILITQTKNSSIFLVLILTFLVYLISLFFLMLFLKTIKNQKEAVR